MDFEEIIDAARHAAGGVSYEAAERAVQSTLQTLAERLPRGEARRILRELPAELTPWVYTETDAEPFGIDEFLARVAQREGTDIETALLHARGVFSALGDALSGEGVAHLAASLPQTFEPLVAEAQHRYLDIMPAGQFRDRVAMRFGLDGAAARQVTEAVLETLADRIARGHVEDLIAQLDPLLHPPLRRGASAIWRGLAPCSSAAASTACIRSASCSDRAPTDSANGTLWSGRWNWYRATWSSRSGRRLASQALRR
jgi:uncharacterized protein (DUF2267 family)